MSTPSAEPSPSPGARSRLQRPARERPRGLPIPLRLLLTATALFAIATLAYSYQQVHRHREQLLQLLDDSGVGERRPLARRAIHNEPDPAHASILAGRALLADALAEQDYAALESNEERVQLFESRLGGLTKARLLASEGLVARATSWEAALLLGGATYLERSFARDESLFLAYRDWEAPLQLAARLGPSQPEPQRFLSMAYLEVWPVLSSEKRDLARSMLTEAFTDQASFNRMIGPWLAVNRDLDDALALLPESSYAWNRVAQMLSQNRDWNRYRDAWQQLRAARRKELELDLAEGMARIAGGDIRRGRDRLGRLLYAPVDSQLAALIERALQSMPPGPILSSQATLLVPWLEWNLERCLYDRCVFDPVVTRRLAKSMPDLAEPVAARAALAYGDLAEAQRIEKETDTPWGGEWEPFRVQKVHALVERGEARAALAEVARIAPEWRERPVGLRARWAAARAAGNDGLRQSIERTLQRTARRGWERLEWRLVENRFFRLEMETSEAADGLLLEWELIPERGSAVAVLLDGRVVDAFAMRPQREILAVDVEIEAGLHVLEVRVLAGSTTTPGRVRLVS